VQPLIEQPAVGAGNHSFDECDSLVRRTADRVRAEFTEMADLRVTAGQLQRLVGVEKSLCTAVIDMLVDGGVLHATRDGQYVRGCSTVVFRR
jgi:hypothetical protein